MARISILNVGMGNLGSLVNRLEGVGADVALAQRSEDLRHASRLILPGVGRFDVAMDKLRNSGLADALCEAVMVRKMPVLGICLGLQMMAGRSEEGGGRGLDWISASCTRLRLTGSLKQKVPHIGWNSVQAAQEGVLLKGIPANSSFYFSHSYHLEDVQPGATAGTTEYGYPFASLIENGNIFGTQFHPEKSYHVGTTLLRNFVAL